jgi:hypothetical protein
MPTCSSFNPWTSSHPVLDCLMPFGHIVANAAPMAYFSNTKAEFVSTVPNNNVKRLRTIAEFSDTTSDPYPDILRSHLNALVN